MQLVAGIMTGLALTGLLIVGVVAWVKDRRDRAAKDALLTRRLSKVGDWTS